MNKPNKNKSLVKERTLTDYCIEVNKKAFAVGHDLHWNVTDSEVYRGRCACGLRVEVRLDGKTELTEQGILKRCRHSLAR